MLAQRERRARSLTPHVRAVSIAAGAGSSRDMQIFLSSTFVDLVYHRRAARETLDRLGQHVLLMETFGARPQEPTRACLDEVEKSDLVLGIYAHRYGSVPAEGELSVTELEYNRAKELKKPVLAFLVDEESDWKPAFIDMGPPRDLLVAFKERIKTECTVDWFKTPLDLAFRIATSVGSYLVKQEVPEQASRIPAPNRAHDVGMANIALLHTSFRYPNADRGGLKYYGIQVIVMAQDAVMKQIRSVTYHLDPAYPPENRTYVVTDRASRFKLKELANGTSIVRAVIDLEGRDQPIELNRFIDLRSDGPRL